MLVPFSSFASVTNGKKRPDPRDPRLRRRLRARDVVLTVPHGAPGNDAVAPDVGCAAHQQLRQNGVDSVLLVSRICRYAECDMNRPQGRAHPYRCAVRVAMREKPAPKLLVDVHSFPDSYPLYSGRDVILIHTPGVTDRKFLEDFAAKMLDAAKELKRKVKVEVQNQHQDVIHDIVREARECGLPASSIMLVECNESGNPALYGVLLDRAIRSLLKERSK